jgi:hypothetical protein
VRNNKRSEYTHRILVAKGGDIILVQLENHILNFRNAEAHFLRSDYLFCATYPFPYFLIKLRAL